VYAGRLHEQPVAIKHETIDHPDDAAAWTKAVVLHMRAKCPHIVVILGVVVRTPTTGGGTAYYTVMERLAGTITKLLLTPGGAHYGADMGLRLALLANVAGGLAYLHAASIIHADVKPDNALLSTSTLPAAKLADFGSSVQRRAGTRTRSTLVGERGTLVYMDLCLLDGSASIATASDVYSFGVMAWQGVSGLQLYETELASAAPANIVEAVGMLRAHVCGPQGKRPPVAVLVKRGVPPAVVALVEQCWSPVQASRPGMAEVHRVLEAAAAAAVGAAGVSGIGVGHGPAAAPASAHASPASSSVALHASPVSAPVHANAPIAAPVAASSAAPVIAPVGLAPLAYAWDDKLLLHGHTAGVRSLALLPYGRLASGDHGGTVRLWDVARGGEATAVLEGHGGYVHALVALPDGCRLAAGVFADRGSSGSVVVWDTGVVPPPRCATIDCGSGVWALAVLSDGRLAAGCVSGGVRLVEVGAGTGTGAVTATLEGHRRSVAALVVLPEGTLASGSWDNTVRLWDVGARLCIATLEGHTESVEALALLADGRLASGSDDASARLWDVTTRACVGVLEGHTHSVWALAALPDGRLASGSADRTIRVWDTRPAAAGAGAAAVAGCTGSAAHATPVVELKGHRDCIRTLQPLPSGRLASGSWDRTVRLWHLPPL